MPPRGLPGNANLEQLKNGAKSFARAVRSGDAGAADVVREFHPRFAGAEPGSPELNAFTHADALLVVARSFGFESWPKLKAFLESTRELARSPHQAPPGATPEDEFLRLACLNYGDDEPERIEAARQMLASSPELSRATIHTAAAAGDVDATRALLARDPTLARARGGPFEWEPLYLAYSRVGDAPPGRSALETARLLLDHGADPNAGYLWEGMCPPFTALTGALGGGENMQPTHSQGLALARLLLQRGADPNDGQGLYNQAGDPSEEWLELLLEFGLGQGEGSGPWYRLLGERLESPRQLLENLMMAAAGLGFGSRVRRLLELGVDPDGTGTRHPIYKGRTPVQQAAHGGNPEVVEMLRAAGAGSALDDVDLFLAACGGGDRERTEAMRAGDPTLVQRAITRRPGQMIAAAERGNLEAVALLIELGFDVNALERTSPLHEAAMRGNLEMLNLLLDHGADAELRDKGYDATPAGWAEHFRQREAQQLLRERENIRTEVVETNLRYGPDDPVRVKVVHRAQRLSVTDDCGAVERSGQPEGAQSAFDRIARSLDVNVQRTGEVWLPVVAAGPGENAITKRIADASLALYQELLELRDDRG